MLKKVLVGIVLFTTAFLFCGCFFAPSDINIYRGQYSELLTVSLHSLLGVYDSEMNQIEVLQTDDYGRILYAYSTFPLTAGDPGASVHTWYNDESRLIGVLICQFVDSDYVYFYEGCNYLIAESPIKEEQPLSQLVSLFFSEEEIAHLKSKNDWGKSLALHNATTAPVNEHWEYQQTQAVEKVIETELGEDWRKIYCAAYARRDDNAWLFFVRFDRRVDGDELLSPGFLVYVENAEGEAHVVEIEEVHNLWDYSTQLTLFKQKIAW